MQSLYYQSGNKAHNREAEAVYWTEGDHRWRAVPCLTWLFDAKGREHNAPGAPGSWFVKRDDWEFARVLFDWEYTAIRQKTYDAATRLTVVLG